MLLLKLQGLLGNSSNYNPDPQVRIEISLAA